VRLLGDVRKSPPSSRPHSRGPPLLTSNSAHGPSRVYAHNTGNPFISDYEMAVMA
jgi:hypothetical protein